MSADVHWSTGSAKHCHWGAEMCGDRLSNVQLDQFNVTGLHKALEHRGDLLSNVLSYRNHSSQPPQITCSHNCSNNTSYLLLNSTTWILSLESLVGCILQEEDQVITSLRVTRPFHFVIVPLSRRIRSFGLSAVSIVLTQSILLAPLQI